MGPPCLFALAARACPQAWRYLAPFEMFERFVQAANLSAHDAHDVLAECGPRLAGDVLAALRDCFARQPRPFAAELRLLVAPAFDGPLETGVSDATIDELRACVPQLRLRHVRRGRLVDTQSFCLKNHWIRIAPRGGDDDGHFHGSVDYRRGHSVHWSETDLTLYRPTPYDV